VVGRPIVDYDLVARIDAVADDFIRRWVAGGEGELTHFGSVVAPVAPHAPDVDFLNRPLGINPESLDQLDAVMAHYRDRGVRPWIEVSPHPQFEQLAAALTAHGAAQTGFHAAMVGPARVAGDPPDGVEVRLAVAADHDVFVELFVEGQEIPAAGREAARRGVGRWFDLDDRRLYLASVEGTPAGVAALSFGRGLGYLASAATVPAWRGRGVQSALLRRRLVDIAAEGVSAACSLCAFGSVSHRNMQRAGLELSHLRAIWRG
jgi:GNAT superfamily N-acetyltransferase